MSYKSLTWSILVIFGSCGMKSLGWRSMRNSGFKVRFAWTIIKRELFGDTLMYVNWKRTVYALFKFSLKSVSVTYSGLHFWKEVRYKGKCVPRDLLSFGFRKSWGESPSPFFFTPIILSPWITSPSIHTSPTPCIDHNLKIHPFEDFPGLSVVKTPCSQCRGTGFDPWSEN